MRFIITLFTFTFTLSLSANSEFQKYHNFDDALGLMHRLSIEQFNTFRTTTYGYSRMGRPMVSMIVTRVPPTVDTKQILITSGTHGDEPVSTEIALGFLNYIASNSKTQRIQNLLQNFEIHVIPITNPDGFILESRYDNGLDPNRQFPDPSHPTRATLGSARDLIYYFNRYNFQGSLDFHAYHSPLVLYPWAYSNKRLDPANEILFRNFSSKFTSIVGGHYGPFWSTIYSAPGSSADYYYWKNGTIALGIEVGSSKKPPANKLPQLIEKYSEAIVQFIEGFRNININLN